LKLPRGIEESVSILNFFPPNRGVDFFFEFLPAKIEESISNFYFEFLPAKIEESISILNFFRGVDFYFEFLPAKLMWREMAGSNKGRRSADRRST
jgi:hypothetical protein